MHETFFRLALRLSDLIKRHRFRDGNCKTAACNVISEFVEARRIRLSHESCHAHIVMSGLFGRAKDRAEDSTLLQGTQSASGSRAAHGVGNCVEIPQPVEFLFVIDADHMVGAQSFGFFNLRFPHARHHNCTVL